MFWRFGFQSASVIDALLQKEGVVLEDIIGEEELIQEVKAQNAKLLDLYSPQIIVLVYASL